MAEGIKKAAICPTSAATHYQNFHIHFTSTAQRVKAKLSKILAWLSVVGGSIC